jgi:hypothetical protein
MIRLLYVQANHQAISINSTAPSSFELSKRHDRRLYLLQYMMYIDRLISQSAGPAQVLSVLVLLLTAQVQTAVWLYQPVTGHLVAPH